MKTFTRYLLYRLQTTAARTLIFAALSIVLTQNIIAECNTAQVKQHNSSGMFMLAVVLGIFATVIPLLETMGFKNRRNLDTLYCFPLRRWKMATVHYLSGLIQVWFIYTVTFIFAFLYLSATTDYYALVYMIPYYFLSLLVGVMMYSVFIFVFGQANTAADGVLFCVLWMFAIAVALAACNTVLFSLQKSDGINMESEHTFLWEWGIIYAPISNLTAIFESFVEVNKAYSNSHIESIKELIRQFYWFIIWGVLGLLSIAGYLLTFIKKGAHKASEISDTWFGFRLLIPLYGYSLLLTESSDLTAIVVIIAMIVGYIIYRRGVKLHASDLVTAGCGLIPWIIGTVL